MNTTETEILPPEGKPSFAIAIPERDALSPSLLANIEAGFKDAFAQAEEWREKALSIQITSIHQKDKMKEAREMRLTLRGIRVAGEKKHKELKSDYLLAGRAIDGVKNILLASIEPLERHLAEQEQYAERLLEQQRQALIAERTEAIRPFVPEGQPLPALELMDEKQWAAYLDDAKLLHSAKIEDARKAEAERIASEQAKAAERERLKQEAERLRLENERLEAERAAAEAKAQAEREKAEAEAKAAAAKAKAEREAIEARAAAEKKAAELKLSAERAAAAERQRIQDEEARKAREELELKFAREAAETREAERKEREAAEAKARKEREDAEKERRRLQTELNIKADNEKKAAAAKLAAEKKAAAAPDKEKILAIAAAVRAVQFPTVSTSEASAVLADIEAKRESFAKWIETQTANL